MSGSQETSARDNPPNSKMNGLRLDNLPGPSKVALSDLSSPFAGTNHFALPPKHKSSGLGKGLKIETTPDALSDRFQRDYVSSKDEISPATTVTSPLSPTDTTKFAGAPATAPPTSAPSYTSLPTETPVVSTPIATSSSLAYPSSVKSGTPSAPPNSAVSPRGRNIATGVQAADMQARILALQRSRSRQRPQANVPSPQLNAFPNSRRSSSNASMLSLPPRSASCTRSSSSAIDSDIAESEELANPNVENDRPASDRISIDTTISSSINSSGRPAAMEELPKICSAPVITSQPSPSVPSTPLSAKHTAASNGFDPNTVISPTAMSMAASGGPISLSRASSFRTKQRSSLSARRGMKLDTVSVSGNNVTTGPMSPTESSTSASEMTLKLPQSKRVTGLSLQDSPNAQARGAATPRAPQPRQLPAGTATGGAPSSKGNRGLFRDYRKYIDIDTGSLNFAGKACVHAQGIEFSTGEKFNISMEQLEYISELGSGNYGTVQKLLHKPNNVLMAVKEIRLELDESSLRQIIMELDVLHRCGADSIIAFYGAFFMEGSVYICMEYMDGGSVNQIYEGGVPERYLKYIVRAVVRGLKELKENFNIIHRDVKPTNVLCSTDGRVKLCDFGVSGNLVASIARTNIGCQAYMAPERIKVDRMQSGNPNQPMAYTAESDIWSLGLSIIEMAKGSYPYPQESFQSIFSQLNAIVEDPAPVLDPQNYSSEACDFVKNLLSKSPTERPRYAAIVKHPWLANVDCTPEEMGAFVRGRRMALREASSVSNLGPEQPTVTLQ